MKKELPNVFANPLNKTFKNVQEVYYGNEKGNDRRMDITTVITKINKIFASPHHVYKSRVRITLKDGIIEKEIVGKSNGYLLTINGENIKILDIEDIERL